MYDNHRNKKFLEKKGKNGGDHVILRPLPVAFLPVPVPHLYFLLPVNENIDRIYKYAKIYIDIYI